MEVNVIYNGLTVVVEGEAENNLVLLGDIHNPSEFETNWIQGPEIIDCYDSEFNEVELSKDDKKDIISCLDKNDFIY